MSYLENFNKHITDNLPLETMFYKPFFFPRFFDSDDFPPKNTKTITTFNPHHDNNKMESNEFIKRILGSNKTNIETRENDVNLEIECPGFSKEDLNIKLEGDLLKIEGNVGNKQIKYEFIVDTKSLDRNKIKAKLNNGILDISIKFKEKYSQNINIE